MGAADHLCGDPDLPRRIAGQRHGPQHVRAGRRPGDPGRRRRRPVRPGADGHRRPRAAARAGALCRLDLGYMGCRQHRRAAARRRLRRTSALVADLLDQHPAWPSGDGDHQQAAEEAADRRKASSHRRPRRAAACGRDGIAAAGAELGRQCLSLALARNPRLARLLGVSGALLRCG